MRKVIDNFAGIHAIITKNTNPLTAWSRILRATRSIRPWQESSLISPKRSFRMKNKRSLLFPIAVIAIAIFCFAGVRQSTVEAGKALELTTTPQTLPFTQNWTNAGLITASDDWSGVAGITGYLGNYDAASPTNVDPRTLLAPFVTNDVDVIANQSSTALTNGGVAEFDGIADPVVALNGSGTADAPHLVVYLNTLGAFDIHFKCNLRDLDASADDAVQQIDIQYRVGGTGNYTSIPGGYFADVTTGGTATQVTPVDIVLPANASSVPLVEVRVMTTNAGGNDEWVGVDDINITGTPDLPLNHVVDLNGDGKTDFVVVRSTGSGQMTWMGQINGAAAPDVYQHWGVMATDFPVPEDFDGDGKSDIAVWRDAPAGQAAFYILQSSTSTVRAELFGQTGDDPSVVGDYDGDGKADLAVCRRSGDLLSWYYRTTSNGPVFARQWGVSADFSAPGDYDGDGKNDFGVQRANGVGSQAVFLLNYASAAPGVLSRLVQFGNASDIIAPGDYDGDGKTDLALVRNVGGFNQWFYEPSTALGTYVGAPWGIASTDFITQGDYDGDGKTDIAVWRSNGSPDQNFFLVRKSSDGALLYQEWGQQNDFPVASYNTH
jgi:hypothetical protein